MKKKDIISVIVVVLVLVMGIVGFILWNNRTIATVTLDINPSIKIDLNRKEKIKRIIALNDDAKEIVSNNFKGKNIDDTLNIIADNLIEKGYANRDDLLEIIVYSEGNINNNELETKLEKTFENKQIVSNIIAIDEVSKEDRKLAKKYGISPAKASYIKDILEVHDAINVDDLANKSVSELNETKETGKYCESDYILEGDWCLKEKERIAASSGKVCRRGYYEYNGICYEEVPIDDTDELYCREDFKLQDNKCIRTLSISAEAVKYTCPSGEKSTRYEAGLTGKTDGDANDIVCVDTSNAKHPVSPCETHDGTEYTLSGGKCYWHRAPVIADGCPGKILVDGMCWDDASNIFICEGYRDGKRYSSRSEYCEHSIKYIEPIISEYKCPADYTLDGNKCLKDESEKALYKQICPSGYTLVDNDKCINYGKTESKEDGFVCEGDNIRLRGNMCVSYDMILAKIN